MKNLMLALSILGSVATPVFAEDLCREQALERGYVGAIEVLRPCNEPAPQQVGELVSSGDSSTASLNLGSSRLFKAHSDKSNLRSGDFSTQ